MTRSNVLALVDALADALNLARDLARDPVTRDRDRDRATRDRDLARLRVVARACGLARDLDLDLDRATLDLDRAWATLDHARAPLDRARKLARDLIFEIQNALRYARDLARRFEAVEVDASGADLSALDITNIWVLEGVVWTEETTWPPGVREQVQSRSREIRPGVYKVQGGSERDPSQLITT